MDMNKLCEDLWGRFCKLDDCLKVVWIEEHSLMDMIVLASHDLNDWLRLGYGSNNFIGFFEDMKNYDDAFKNFDSSKKWICVSPRNHWIRSTDSLTIVVAAYCNLLREFRSSRMRKLLGYTDDEVRAIIAELKDIDVSTMNEIWRHFIKKKAESGSIRQVQYHI